MVTFYEDERVHRAVAEQLAAGASPWWFATPPAFLLKARGSDGDRRAVEGSSTGGDQTTLGRGVAGAGHGAQAV